MDDRISAVLDTYHARIQAERGPDGPATAADGRDQRMRAVGPAGGQLINLLAASLEAPVILELGTSFGYSGIWLAEAAQRRGGRVITMEIHDYKSAHARTMAERAGLDQLIDFRVGDAVAMLDALDEPVDFVFVDLWKDLYLPCLELFLPKLAPGAIVVADNMSGPHPEVRRYQEALRAKPGISSVTLPVGHGLEVSRYQPA